MRKGFILLALLLIVAIAPVSAQTNDSRLLQMLARIPDTSAARAYLSYIDYRALIAARPGAPSVTSWQEFQSYKQSQSDKGALLMSTLQGINSGPQFYGRNLMQAGDMPSVVGFDIFAIERAAEYGIPPGTVTILEGAFDATNIFAAFAKRGYVETNLLGFQLLCAAEGCASGIQLNPSDINPANPFGGELGRQQPVIVADRLVASSPSINALTESASASAGQTPSLAQQPDYSAAAEALSANGTLIQAYFIQPADILPASTAAVNPQLSAEQAKALLATLKADFVPLSPYNLIAIADSATETEQQALVALVYTTEAEAQTAAKLFPDHLEKALSAQTEQSFGDLLTARGVTSVEVSVSHASSDRYVMLLTLRAPLPSEAIPAGETQRVASSLIFRLLVRAYQGRDLGWLATQF